MVGGVEECVGGVEECCGRGAICIIHYIYYIVIIHMLVLIEIS